MIYSLAMYGNVLLQKDKKDEISYIPYSQFQEMIEKDQIQYVLLNSTNSNMQFLPTESYLKSKNIEPDEDYKTLLKDLKKSKETSINPKILPWGRHTLRIRKTWRHLSSPKINNCLQSLFNLRKKIILSLKLVLDFIMGKL